MGGFRSVRPEHALNCGHAVRRDRFRSLPQRSWEQTTRRVHSQLVRILRLETHDVDTDGDPIDVKNARRSFSSQRLLCQAYDSDVQICS